MRDGGRIRTLAAALVARLRGHPGLKSGNVDVRDAPRAWIAYAQRLSQRLQMALDGHDDAARRLRGALERLAAAEAESGSDLPTLRLRTWVDSDGTIERVESAQGVDCPFEADLLAAFVDKHVGAPPPRDMRQPVVVLLSLAIAP